jgi:glycerol-3-phosphate dehydrogenase
METCCEVCKKVKTSDRYDIAIIGAGIVGALLAYELSKTNQSVVVIEKERDVALGATKANSGIIHAGYDPRPGTLKAMMNVEGNRMYETLATELSFGFRRTGSLAVAVSERETRELEVLFERGQENQVPGLELLEAKDALALETNLTPHLQKALHAPTTGIVDPWEAAIAALESAVDNGVHLKLSATVVGIEKPETPKAPFVIRTSKGILNAMAVVNAAGIHTGEISGMVNEGQSEFLMVPKRGQYFVLDKATSGLVQRVIYPTPTEKGKGVLVIPTLHGNLLVGPDNVTLSAGDSEAVQTTTDGLAFVQKQAQRLVPGLPFHLGIANFAGIRADSEESDFILRASRHHERLIHAAGIKSPGLSAAPSISKYLAGLLREVLPGWKVNPAFVPGRRPRPVLSNMSSDARAAYIRANPAFGKIVCRCEMVSEAEVIDSIRRSVGATSLNGVKRRVRPGGGRCQGGFCAPRIMEILARELGISESEILLEKDDSRMVFMRG